MRVRTRERQIARDKRGELTLLVAVRALGPWRRRYRPRGIHRGRVHRDVE